MFDREGPGVAGLHHVVVMSEGQLGAVEAIALRVQWAVWHLERQREHHYTPRSECSYKKFDTFMFAWLCKKPCAPLILSRTLCSMLACSQFSEPAVCTWLTKQSNWHGSIRTELLLLHVSLKLTLMYHKHTNMWVEMLIMMEATYATAQSRHRGINQAVADTLLWVNYY